ncbi:hypothetical protein A9Q92_00765 [Methylophaga sp. 42_8_T64]|nr:hypothetical protein A9Q92_00765 [Methylophaga sp. 42_8_T64]
MTIKLCKLAFIMTLIVMTLGALTRLLDAGLGCPDWPGCYGQLIPPDSVQFTGTTLIDEGKAWMEMIHRYVAATLGLIILFIAVKIERDKTVKPTVRWLSRSILLLVVVQGLFGMLTVVLKLLPQVVTLHLISGMLLLALLFLLLLQLTAVKPVQISTHLRPYALTVLLLLSCQIALGGWTSSNYAGLACPDFPTCQNQWLPELELAASFNITDVSKRNYEGGLLTAQSKLTIHVVHRLMALILLVSIIFLLLSMRKSPQLQQQAKILLGLTLLQMSLGIANAVLMLPLPLALAHNTGAALLLLNVIYINYRLSPLPTTVVIDDNSYANQSAT